MTKPSNDGEGEEENSKQKQTNKPSFSEESEVLARPTSRNPKHRHTIVGSGRCESEVGLSLIGDKKAWFHLGKIKKGYSAEDVKSFVDKTFPGAYKMAQQFSLRWSNYLSRISEAFGSLRHEEDLVDVTLSCEGRKIKAHKVLLSACSPYFRDMFKDNPCQHPVIVFRNVKYEDLKSIIDFIYQGEVSVLHEQLESFLSTAEMLEVKGLSDKNNEDDVQTTQTNPEDTEVTEQQTKEGSIRHASISSLTSYLHSNSAKRRKSNREECESERLCVTEIFPVVKEEVKDPLYIEDEDVKLSDLSEPATSSNSVPTFKETGDDTEMYQNIRPRWDAAHKLELLPNKRDRLCAVCETDQRALGKRGKSTYWCPGCNAGIHKHCFQHLKHYWRPTQTGRKRKFSSSSSKYPCS